MVFLSFFPRGCLTPLPGEGTNNACKWFRWSYMSWTSLNIQPILYYPGHILHIYRESYVSTEWRASISHLNEDYDKAVRSWITTTFKGYSLPRHDYYPSSMFLSEMAVGQEYSFPYKQSPKRKPTDGVSWGGN